ncbi:MAG: shikimate kinase [Maribacter sp.]|nr:MAG: shikimate kinase [Maribacter sp.]
MGSGKSTIGRILADRLGIGFIDLDEYVEAREGAPIPRLFESKGEVYFRKKEHGYLKRILADKHDLVLSTGGGTPCYGGNMETILEATPNVFYLKATIPGLVARLAPEKAHRPLIANIPDGELPEFIGKHLFERSFFYSKAEHAIQTDGKSVGAIAAEVEGLLV